MIKCQFPPLKNNLWRGVSWTLEGSDANLGRFRYESWKVHTLILNDLKINYLWFQKKLRNIALQTSEFLEITYNNIIGGILSFSWRYIINCFIPYHRPIDDIPLFFSFIRASGILSSAAAKKSLERAVLTPSWSGWNSLVRKIYLPRDLFFGEKRICQKSFAIRKKCNFVVL